MSREGVEGGLQFYLSGKITFEDHLKEVREQVRQTSGGRSWLLPFVLLSV